MTVQPIATVETTARLCGLALARETGRLLAWDAGQRLYLWNLEGKSLGNQNLPVPLAAAQITDDGQRIAAAAKNGQLWWFDGDLQFLFDQSLGFEPVGLALEALGQYLVVSDRDRRAHLLSVSGEQRSVVETPKALRFLTFVPSQTRFVGAGEVGLIACFDAQGKSVWQQVVVSHIGSICTDGMGQSVWVACYTEGLHRFDPNGKDRGVLRTRGSCRLACCDFDGTVLLTAEEPASLSLLKSDGTVLGSYAIPARRSAAFLVLDALGERGAYAAADGPIMLFSLTR